MWEHTLDGTQGTANTMFIHTFTPRDNLELRVGNQATSMLREESRELIGNRHKDTRRMQIDAEHRQEHELELKTLEI